MDNKILNALGLSHLISIIKEALNGKQDSLTAGRNVSIKDNKINASTTIFEQRYTSPEDGDRAELDQYYYFDASNKGQCVWYACGRIREISKSPTDTYDLNGNVIGKYYRSNGWGFPCSSGIQYAADMYAMPNTKWGWTCSKDNPRPGDLAIFDHAYAGQGGHVIVLEEINYETGVATTTEYNNNSDLSFHRKTWTLGTNIGNLGGFLGYMHNPNTFQTVTSGSSSGAVSSVNGKTGDVVLKATDVITGTYTSTEKENIRKSIGIFVIEDGEDIPSEMTDGDILIKY